MTSSIAVIGTGYVGLTSGAALARFGHRVVCADVSADRIESMRSGLIPFFEPGLSELVAEGIAGGRLSFTTDNAAAVADADFVYLCVPTPEGSDGSADLSFVREAARQIGPHLRHGAVVVNKSTVPIRSTTMVHDVIGRADVHVVSNPEFLREGSAVYDCLFPDRIVVGGDHRQSAERVAALYEQCNARVVITNAAAAETMKYVANAFLATKLSFVNAVAAMCEAVGADVDDVIEGLSLDHRIGPHFMRPGPGWGGSCLPKDTQALVRMAAESGYDFSLLRSAIETNDVQRRRMIDKITRAAGGDLVGAQIGAWGIAFKAGTDDVRDSPAVGIMGELLRAGASVRAYDPLAVTDLAGLEPAATPLEACDGADVLVVLTEWPDFREVELGKVAAAMNGTVVVDTRNLLDREAAAAAGLRVVGVGR